MIRIVAIPLALLLFGGTAFGQCYTPYCTPYREVIVKEVPAPIAVPVLLPATVFQYLPALAPAVPVAVTPATPAAPAASKAAPKAAPSSADIDRIVRERVDAALRERLNPGDKGPPPLILPGELQPKQQSEQNTPASSADLNQHVASMLASKSCVQCHTAGNGTPVKGGVTLFIKKDNQMFFQPSVPKRQILDAVIPDQSGNAAMPPNGPVLAANELDLLRQWDAQK